MLPDVDTDLFQLPDGSSFAVVDATEPERTVGFTVADLDNAVMELRHAGIEQTTRSHPTDDSGTAHFRAPDGQLYELIEPTKRAERPLKGVSPNLGLSAVELASLGPRSEYGTAGPFRILRGLPTMRRTEPHTEGAGRV